MHARLGIGRLHPGKMDGFVSAVRESVYPAYKQQRGFKGALLLTDVKTDKVISITLWETEADLMASETTSRQQRDKLGDLFAVPRTREVYEVTVQV